MSAKILNKEKKNGMVNALFIKKVWNIFVILLLVGIYIFIADNYVAAKICLKRNTFLMLTIAYVGGCIFLFAGKKIRTYWQKVPKSRYFEKVIFLLVPLLAFYLEEIIYNPLWMEITIVKVLVNYSMLLLLQIVLLLLIRREQVAFSIVLIVSWVYGIANYYVLEFKGNPLLPSDLMSYKTAMDVAGNYTFYLEDSIVTGTLLMLWGIGIAGIFSRDNREYLLKKYVYSAAIGGAVILAGTFIIQKVDWADIFEVQIGTWETDAIYFENGGTLSFIMEAQAMTPSKPWGYSKQEAQAVLEEYTIEEKEEAEVKPSIIVIMNESFTDLREIGEFESDEYLEHWNSMTDYIMKGTLYPSAYGGGTCNSEFEFLTGHSMMNFSGMVYPYQMYNMDGVSNMASVLAEYGYHTIAIHPAEKNNWNREKVYQQLGFEDFISLEDMEDVQYIRNYASDAYDYGLVKKAFEESEEPVFIFNVTIQNHGGYSEPIDENILETVKIEEQYEQYGDVKTFLTLMKESDKAFAELLDYFESVDEPVIVCLFGDHQPVLSTGFITELQGTDTPSYAQKQAANATPYVIWSNYDMEGKERKVDMSLNYLGANVLEAAGVRTEYTSFLLETQKEIPIINTIGNYTESTGWQVNDWLDERISTYRMLQYYMLFDAK